MCIGIGGAIDESFDSFDGGLAPVVEIGGDEDDEDDEDGVGAIFEVLVVLEVCVFGCFTLVEKPLNWLRG